jgi:hypothetical protein
LRAHPSVAPMRVVDPSTAAARQAVQADDEGAGPST